MPNAKACREAFTATLLELATQDKDIIAVSSDARGSCSLTPYIDALPDQFVEVGIAEQNEIGIAAGLASVGKKPYVCAPACFLTARSLEQLKVDVAYSHQNVKIFAVSGGVSYGALGASHHTLHDIATLRCFPDISIILPCDAVQTEAVLRAIATRKEAVYIRVGREKVPLVYDETIHGKPFEFGKANVLKEGSDVTLVACGEMVHHTYMAAQLLEKKGINARVLDIPTLKPFDEDAIVAAAKETGAIITVEEHSIYGGLGSAVNQVVVQHHPTKVKNLAFPDEYLVTGNSAELFAHYGLDAAGIAQVAQSMIAELRSTHES
ncbi:MAG: transketolase family protein [Spirochaetia bacterium]|nr:transketolase family protein [Spirochaetia bacterium]NCC89568.1 transketolase family protein [Spirochaetia bacterium]